MMSLDVIKHIKIIVKYHTKVSILSVITPESYIINYIEGYNTKVNENNAKIKDNLPIDLRSPKIRFLPQSDFCLISRYNLSCYTTALGPGLRCVPGEGPSVSR